MLYTFLSLFSLIKRQNQTFFKFLVHFFLTLEINLVKKISENISEKKNYQKKRWEKKATKKADRVYNALIFCKKKSTDFVEFGKKLKSYKILMICQ